ncbi:8114_t:CDS:2, partial [Entrophospora sp. SA101]
KDSENGISLFYKCLHQIHEKEKWTRKEIKASMEQMEQFDTTKFFRLMENNPLRLVYWCEEQFEATLERKKHQSFCDDRIKQDVFSKYMTLQTHQSRWLVFHDNGWVNIVASFAKSITWQTIKSLDYNHPMLSFIVDLTEPQRIMKFLPISIYNKIACIPDFLFEISQ